VWTATFEFDESVGLVAGAAGVLLVDTRFSERHARELLVDVRSLIDLPLVAVVNTHGHWDHAFGNQAFPDVPIWGHTACPEFMKATAPSMLQKLRAEPGFADVLDDLRGVVVTPPTHLVDDAASIDLGGRVVTLEHFGKGHTDNDLVIRVTDADVLFVGDLMKGSGPPGYRDAFPGQWVHTAERLRTTVGPEHRLVCGHGPNVGEAQLSEWIDLLRGVADLASLVAAEEASEDEAARVAGVHPRAFSQALGRISVEAGAG
jgi:glyoxylase-like metal-dependent hydrolase (beta-lactamase superfamily II)